MIAPSRCKGLAPKSFGISEVNIKKTVQSAGAECGVQIFRLMPLASASEGQGARDKGHGI